MSWLTPAFDVHRSALPLTVTTCVAVTAAQPPLPCQACGWPASGATASPLTMMPMSWLYPAFVVHLAALPVITTSALAPGVRVMAGLVASTGFQVDPSLLARKYCWVTAL